MIDAGDFNEEPHVQYLYTPTSEAHDIYISVETYYFNIVPYGCTTGEDAAGYQMTPVLFYEVWQGDVRMENYKYYLDYYS